MADEDSPSTQEGGSDDIVTPVIASTDSHQDGGPIQPGPVDEQGINDADISSIQLPDLQTTHRFIEALKSATLEGLGMEPPDIADLRQPQSASILVDPSPLVQSL